MTYYHLNSSPSIQSQNSGVRRVTSTTALLAIALSVCACTSKHSGALTGRGATTTSAISANSGCRFASLPELSSATKLSLTQTEDRGSAGCLYRGGEGYVKLGLFATSDWDAQLNEQSRGANSHIEDVAGMGAEAKRISPTLFVRADSRMSFRVLVSPSQSLDDEIAVAKVVLPRVQAG
jgi:hypothetical protein